MRPARLRIAALAGVAVLALSGAGCTQVRESFGLEKNPPDEFRVVSRAPLSLPPDYQLRPPAPGATRPQEGTVRSRARQTVFGREDDQQAEPAYAGAAGMSSGERALLGSAGADQAPADIRQIVDAETRRLNEASRSFVDTLVFWREPESSSEVVDAREEARRLQENAALGKPVTEGESPTIERKERGILEGIF